MRVPRFRAWLTEDKVMLPVKNISFFGYHMETIMPPDKQVKKVRQETKLMWYTGLKDKHGVEIYEGVNK